MGRQTGANGTKLGDKQSRKTQKKSKLQFFLARKKILSLIIYTSRCSVFVVDVHIIVKPPLSPPEVRLTATRSRGSSTVADSERRTTKAKMMRGSDRNTTTTLTSSRGTRRRRGGARVTATTEPKKRGIITASLTAPTVETN